MNITRIKDLFDELKHRNEKEEDTLLQNVREVGLHVLLEPLIIPRKCQERHSVGVCSTSGLTLKVLVVTIDAQWEGMEDVGSARHEPALLPPCPTIRILSYSN